MGKPRLRIDLNVPYARTLIRILFNTERGKKNLTVTMLWVAVFLFSGILTAHGKATHDNAARRLNDALGIGNKVFPVEGKTYVYINEKKTWTKARTACKALGGDLASILSYEEYDKIKEILTNATECKYIWIGAERTGSEEDKKHNWFWLTGEPLPFNHAKWYSAAEPNTDHDSHVEKYGLIGTAKTSLKDLMSSLICFFFLGWVVGSCVIFISHEFE